MYIVMMIEKKKKKKLNVQVASQVSEGLKT